MSWACSTGLYVVFTFFLPNRAYYAQLGMLELSYVLWGLVVVAGYLFLQVLWLATLSWALRRYLHLSVVKHLALVLERQWGGVQSELIFWVLFNAQTYLAHFGTIRGLLVM